MHDVGSVPDVYESASHNPNKDHLTIAVPQTTVVTLQQPSLLNLLHIMTIIITFYY